VTLRELLNDRTNRRADGSLTDEAYAAYRATSANHPDGFVPDDELDITTVAAARQLGRLGGLKRSPAKAAANRARMLRVWAERRAGTRPARKARAAATIETVTPTK